jgi:hypothetical protein
MLVRGNDLALVVSGVRLPSYQKNQGGGLTYKRCMPIISRKVSFTTQIGVKANKTIMLFESPRAWFYGKLIPQPRDKFKSWLPPKSTKSKANLGCRHKCSRTGQPIPVFFKCARGALGALGGSNASWCLRFAPPLARKWHGMYASLAGRAD